MLVAFVRSHLAFQAASAALCAVAASLAIALALTISVHAQQAATADTAQQPAASASGSGAAQAPSAGAETQQPAAVQRVQGAAPSGATGSTAAEGQVPASAAQEATAAETLLPGGVTEDQLKQQLVGKALYLRGGYLDNSLSFDEHGRLAGHSPQGSYTLSAIQIDKVRLTKHKVELDGIRYGLHFVGQLAYEDPSKALDRVRITPKKKSVKITIDREIVVNPKKKKEAKAGKEKKQKRKIAVAAAVPAPAAVEPVELSEADQLKASIAAAPEAERPANPSKVTTTVSPAHATKVLKDALDQIFAQGLDERMMAAMPEFWKLYYQAVAAKVDYRPKDPAILRQNTVDKKAVLLSKFEPDSNEFAQQNGVAGMAQYHAVIGPDGKVGEIAVSRPIGFGLDENAVAAIRKASFQPAMKEGRPVPVLVDLNVPFRIFSKMTNVHSPPDAADKPAEPVLPGPYSLPRP